MFKGNTYRKLKKPIASFRETRTDPVDFANLLPAASILRPKPAVTLHDENHHTHTHTHFSSWLIDRLTLLTLDTNEKRRPSSLLQKIISIILLSPVLSWSPVLNTRYAVRSVLCARVQDALLVTSANRLCIEPSRFTTFNRIIPILSFLHVVVVVE